MSGLVCYFALEASLIWLLALVFVTKIKTDIASCLHFGLLSTMALQGLLSLFFFYIDVPLSFSSVNLALLIVIGLMVLTGFRLRIFTRVTKPLSLVPRIDISVIAGMSTSYFVAAIAGVWFFSSDLIPSSMTGDPARHFQILINLHDSSVAYPYKPIYYLWAGIVTFLPIPFAEDRLFVLFNIFSLGLFTSSIFILANRLLGNQKWCDYLLLAVLTASSYAYFSLQYGYYTLLLSAAFFFTALALLVDYLESNSIILYGFVTLIACGVVLTHSYLAPEFFMIAFASVLWQSHKKQCSYVKQIARYIPYWMFAGGVVVLSMQFFSTEKPMQTWGKVILAQGFGTEVFLGNIFPFLILSLPYFLFDDNWKRKQILLLFLACTTTFSLIMYQLSENGLAHTYYVARNQLVVAPLLVIGSIGTLRLMEVKTTRLANLFRFSLLLMALLPYFLYQKTALATTNVRLLSLLDENSGFIYFVNAKAASYSPLQFTSRDRELLETGKQKCFDKKPEKMAVLGTDHQVMWFGIYADVFPSLFRREDGFIGSHDYIANYDIWEKSIGDEYIAVMHTNYLIPRSILSKIKSRAELVCEGDSFAVYRKYPL